MKVEINTAEKHIHVQANDIVRTVATMDKFIATMRLARGWLKRELEQKEPKK